MKKKPNVVLYFSDQQRADTCGCYGQPLNVTPNLDELARTGVKFENAFTAQPVCGPCRAIFQTGRYPTETGCFRNSIALPKDTKTLANYVEENGYETAYVGKWHLASTGDLEAKPYEDYTTSAIPLERRGGYTGFWRAADILEFTSHGYDGYVFDENNKKCEFKGYRADCVTNYAIDYLNQYEEKKPFFMTISYIEPHHQNDRNCYEGPKESKEKYKNCVIPDDLKNLEGDYENEYPDYLGAINSLDNNLGRLIAKLKEIKIFDNTVIVYVSDHGSHFKTRNKDENLNGYDDYKRTGHDAALKVPFVICGGAFVGGKCVQEIVSTVSLPKTLLGIMGIDVGEKMVGENLIDVVNQKLPDRKNEAFAQISESRIGRVLRTKEFLYAVVAPKLNGGEKASSDTYVDDYLYDLKIDPNQLNNVVNDEKYSEKKAIMRIKLLEWIEKEEHCTPKINSK